MGKEAITGDSQIQRISRRLDIALSELLINRQQRHTTTHSIGRFLCCRGGKNIAKNRVRTLKAGGTGVGNVVRGNRQLGRLLRLDLLKMYKMTFKYSFCY